VPDRPILPERSSTVPGGATSDAVGGATHSDLTRLARGGALNLIGAVSSGVFGFLLFVVVTHGLRRSGAGVFFEAIAVFSIVANTSELGADDGLVRMIPRYRALERTQDLRITLAVGLWPVALAGALLGGLLIVFAPQLSDLFIRDPGRAGALVPYLRVLGPFVPIAAVSTTALAGTRGFGTMRPFVAVDNIGKPFLRFLLAFLVLAAGLGSLAVAMSWAVPVLLGLLVALRALWLRLRAAERHDPLHGDPPRVPRDVSGEFWRFAAPRGASVIFATTIFQLDTLLVGALRSTGQTAVYTASSRFLMVGGFALQAVQLVTAPLISDLLARRSPERARTVYQVATLWLVVPAWPIYLAIAVYAPVFLRVFPPSYQAGQTALTILALAQLVAMATGPVMVVLLMGGKSGWTMAISGTSVVMNIALNLVLIPRFGINGAALAWAASIVFNNACGMILVRVLLGLNPFGGAFPLVTGAALGCFGGLGLAARALLGPSIPGFVAFAAVSGAAYLWVLGRFKEQLNLPLLREALTRRRRV
jgi:O-antigen/teichoic acid export membrane protein